MPSFSEEYASALGSLAKLELAAGRSGSFEQYLATERNVRTMIAMQKFYRAREECLRYPDAVHEDALNGERRSLLEVEHNYRMCRLLRGEYEFYTSLNTLLDAEDIAWHLSQKNGHEFRLTAEDTIRPEPVLALLLLLKRVLRENAAEEVKEEVADALRKRILRMLRLIDRYVGAEKFCGFSEKIMIPFLDDYFGQLGEKAVFFGEEETPRYAELYYKAGITLAEALLKRARAAEDPGGAAALIRRAKEAAELMLQSFPRDEEYTPDVFFDAVTRHTMQVLYLTCCVAEEEAEAAGG